MSTNHGHVVMTTTRNYIFFFLLVFLSFTGNAQQTWQFGIYLKAYFPNTTGAPIIAQAPASPMYAPYTSASAYDKNGNPKFFTNGTLVYNRNNEVMSVKASNVNNVFGTYALTVPHLIDTNLHYVFTQYRSYGIVASMVDLTLNNGLGNVRNDKILFPTLPADNEFVVVKQHYNNGYWLIGHKKGTNEYHSYKIDNDSIYYLNPVVSIVGEASHTNIDYNWRRNTFISNSSGDELLHTFTGSAELAQVYLLEFDKKCGTVRLKQKLEIPPTQDEQPTAHACYSPDYNKIYIAYYLKNFGGTELYQFTRTGNTVNPTPRKLALISVIGSDLQPAPNGVIYLSAAEGPNATGKASTMVNPNSDFPNININAIDFSNGNENQYTFSHFPIFFTDTSNNHKTQFQKPSIAIKNPCLDENTTIELKNQIECDSFYWTINNKLYLNKSVNINFSNTGKIPLTFTWFVCGFKYQLKDSIEIQSKPTFELGEDSFLCLGNTLLLSGPPQSTKYLWNTGDSASSILVNKAGKYILTAQKGLCAYTDSINIDYHPPIMKLLNDEYFICDKDKELVKLDAGEGFTNYKWLPTEDTTQWIIVGELGSYFVVVRDYRGCNGNGNTLLSRRCPVEIFFPNAFTPNNNSLNETFKPIGSDIVSYQLKIYNRWGEIIFNSNRLELGWDGKVNGADAPVDTYIYTCEYEGYIKKQLKSFEISGTFTLIR